MLQKHFTSHSFSADTHRENTHWVIDCFDFVQPLKWWPTLKLLRQTLSQWPQSRKERAHVFSPWWRPSDPTSRCWCCPSSCQLCISSQWLTRCSSSKTWQTEATQSSLRSLPWCRRWRSCGGKAESVSAYTWLHGVRFDLRSGQMSVLF